MRLIDNDLGTLSKKAFCGFDAFTNDRRIVFHCQETLPVKVIRCFAYITGKPGIITATDGSTRDRNNLREFGFGYFDTQATGDLLNDFDEKLFFKLFPDDFFATCWEIFTS